MINFAKGEKNGKPLVLLHGGPVRWQMWNDYIPVLAERWQIYAPDLRGHGKTGKARSGYAYQKFVSNIVDFIWAKVEKPVMLAGASWGGAIAIGVVAQSPDLVQALVLLEPSLSFVRENGLKPFPGIHEWFKWLDETLTLSNSFEEIVARCKEYDPNSEDVEEFAQNVYDLDQQFISTFENEALLGYRPRQLLQQVNCPTLLVYGEPDLGSVLNDEDIALFKEYVPHGQTFHARGVGHAVINDPAGPDVMRQVVQFLNLL